MNSVHTLQTYFFKIHSDIIPPLHLGLPSGLISSLQVLLSKFSIIYHLPHTCYRFLPSHLHDSITLMTYVKAYKLQSSSLCSLLHSPSLRSQYSPKHPTVVLLLCAGAMMIEVQVVWDVTPWSVAVRYQHFGGRCCFHLQGDGGTCVL
jgi:hypothetical protein